MSVTYPAPISLTRHNGRVVRGTRKPQTEELFSDPYFDWLAEIEQTIGRSLTPYDAERVAYGEQNRLTARQVADLLNP